MVEKDTGRSRGFGFVSYDSPDAAALAIKELNGYAVSNDKCVGSRLSWISFSDHCLSLQIGNKRLKVQHKQIRPQEQNYDQRGMGPGGPYGDHYGNQYGGRGGYGGRGHLPPSGPMAAGFYTNRQSAHDSLGPNGDPSMVGVGMSHSYEDPSPSPGGAGPSGQDDRQGPLSSMDPLRQTLPDVGGAATSAVEGEI